MPKGPKKQPTGGYGVGFCRPPVSGQFQPGKSGNPRGGKKREATLAGALRAELATTQKVRENGKVKTLTKAEILAKQWVRQGLEGKNAAVQQIAKHEPKALAQAVAAASVSEAEHSGGNDLSETDLAMMRWLVQGLEEQNATGSASEVGEDQEREDTDV